MNILLKCCIVHFFVWNQCLGNCKNDQSLQFLVSVPPLAVYPITNSNEEEAAAESTKARVKGREHTVFSLYQKDPICRSIQREVRCGHRVSFPSITCIKAVKNTDWEQLESILSISFCLPVRLAKILLLKILDIFEWKKDVVKHIFSSDCLIFKTN